MKKRYKLEWTIESDSGQIRISSYICGDARIIVHNWKRKAT